MRNRSKPSLASSSAQAAVATTIVAAKPLPERLHVVPRPANTDKTSVDEDETSMHAARLRRPTLGGPNRTIGQQNVSVLLLVELVGRTLKVACVFVYVVRLGCI